MPNRSDVKHRQALERAAALSRMGYWRLDITTGVMFWSPEIFAIYGLAEQNAVPDLETAIAFYHPDDRGEVAWHLERAIEHGTAFEFLLRLWRQDGELRTVMSRGEAERAADGTVTAIFGVFVDMTGQAAMMSALKQSYARYRLLADHGSDLITLKDAEHRRHYVSPAASAMLGYEPDELLGTTPDEFAHPDDLARVRAAMRHSSEFGDFVIEYRHRHKNGTYVWVESRGRVHDRSGNMVSRLRDISAQKDAEERLRRSEASYRRLAESIGDLVMCLGRDLRPRFVSPACHRLFGYEPAGLMDSSPLEFCHPEDRQALAACLAPFRNGSNWPCGIEPIRYRLLRHDGSYAWVEAVARAQAGSDDLVVTIRDVSARVAAEQQLASANRALSVLAQQDGLTGLGNRRGFDAALCRAWNHSIDNRSPLSLIMLDVDHFKNFNDRHGHQAGDDCLKGIAAIIDRLVTPLGAVANRYGGEEFAILLPNVGPETALKVAHDLRSAIEAFGRGQPSRVTASVGVSGVAGGRWTSSPRSREALLTSADAALYAAKREGRNQVRLASDKPVPSAMARSPAAA